MEDCFISIPINGGKNICLSPIPTEFLSDGERGRLGGGRGVFLYETKADAPEALPQILAKFATVEAAERVAYLIEVAYRALAVNRPIERFVEGLEG